MHVSRLVSMFSSYPLYEGRFPIERVSKHYRCMRSIKRLCVRKQRVSVATLTGDLNVSALSITSGFYQPQIRASGGTVEDSYDNTLATIVKYSCRNELIHTSRRNGGDVVGSLL